MGFGLLADKRMYYENSVGKVYYEVHGRGNDGPAIVFSHGVSMDHKTFNAQVEALQDIYRVIVWDLPYHGLSSAIDYELPFSATAADFTVGILDQAGIDQAVLVGQSLGSFVAQQTAYKYPERVKASVHIGGVALYPKTTALLKVLNPLISLTLNVYPDKVLYRAFAKHKALREETRNYLMEVSSRTGKKVILHLTQEMLRDMIRGIPDPSKEPLLLCVGDHDLAFIKGLSNKWQKRVRGSRLEVIPRAHHIANQDNPEEFNRIIEQFLSSLSS